MKKACKNPDNKSVFWCNKKILISEKSSVII